MLCNCSLLSYKYIVFYTNNFTSKLILSSSMSTGAVSGFTIWSFQALKSHFPPILLRASLTHQVAHEHSTRLQRLISEEHIDLTAISSLFELTSSCFGVLITSKVSHLVIEEQRRFYKLIQTGLVNLLFAMAVYWPCDSCRTNRFVSRIQDSIDF